MKNINLLIVSLFSTFLLSCESDLDDPSNISGGSSPDGQIMFWLQSDLGCGNITVNLQGEGNRTISSSFSSGTPSCGTSGCATYTVKPGTYSMTASCTGGKTWQGLFTVTAGGCKKIQLTSTGTSGGGSGSGGGGNTGKTELMFFTLSDLGCGNITVSIPGHGSQRISQFYNSAPNCGSVGCATFTGISSGTYDYSASCSSSTWSGKITAVNGQCSRLELRATGSGGGGGGSNCYWEETSSNSIQGVRGDACGSPTSLRIYYTNNSNQDLRVAWYLADENGKFRGKPYVEKVEVGTRNYHHICKSTGRYRLFVAPANQVCTFPELY